MGHASDKFARKQTASMTCNRAEQPMVLRFKEMLLAKGHEVEAHHYYELGTDGRERLIGKCDLFDRTSGTLYEAKSNLDFASLDRAVGQLLRYSFLEMAHMQTRTRMQSWL